MSKSFKGGVIRRGTSLRTIPLSAFDGRLLASNAVPNTAANGGVLSADTAPTLARTSTINPNLTIAWAGGNVIPVQWQKVSPVDIDISKPVILHVLASRTSTTDTCTLHVAFHEGPTGTDLLTGTLGNTSSLTTAVSHTSFTISPGTFAATTTNQKQWNVVITPNTHATDAIQLTGAWVAYNVIV